MARRQRHSADRILAILQEHTGVPIGFWRSVSGSYNGFVVESFYDELAHVAKKDPYEFRRDLLGASPRYLGVLKLAAEKAGWGTPAPEGRARGIAVFTAFQSFVAEVAEVSVASDGAVTVHKLVCAVDCGPVVNPAIFAATGKRIRKLPIGKVVSGARSAANRKPSAAVPVGGGAGS